MYVIKITVIFWKRLNDQSSSVFSQLFNKVAKHVVSLQVYTHATIKNYLVNFNTC